MEINRAGVLELVDRRDLKFAAPTENKAVFEKRPPSFSPNLPEEHVICKTLPVF
jgi:hypothetical protein